jgi:hypothetical protein
MGNLYSDSRLTRIAERLNKGWRKVRYTLVSNGYAETTQTTYELARELIREGFYSETEITKGRWENVDKYHLQILLDGARTDSIMYTLLQYPTLGNFSAFYYKVRNKELHKLIHKQDFESFVAYQENTLECLHILKERFFTLRLMSSNDVVIDELENEITVIDALIEFIEICDDLTDSADRIFDTYLDDIKDKLNSIENTVTEIEYQEIKLYECKRVQSLAGKFEDAVFYLTDASEN